MFLMFSDEVEAIRRSSILGDVSMHVTDETVRAKGREYVPGPDPSSNTVDELSMKPVLINLAIILSGMSPCCIEEYFSA